MYITCLKGRYGIYACTSVFKTGTVPTESTKIGVPSPLKLVVVPLREPNRLKEDGPSSIIILLVVIINYDYIVVVVVIIIIIIITII